MPPERHRQTCRYAPPSNVRRYRRNAWRIPRRPGNRQYMFPNPPCNPPGSHAAQRPLRPARYHPPQRIGRGDFHPCGFSVVEPIFIGFYTVVGQKKVLPSQNNGRTAHSNAPPHPGYEMTRDEARRTNPTWGNSSSTMPPSAVPFHPCGIIAVYPHS